MLRYCVLLVVLVGTGMATHGAMAAEVPPAKVAVALKEQPFSVLPTPILLMDTSWYWSSFNTKPGTVWRYHETWQTDVVRMPDGQLVRVDPFASLREKDQDGSSPSPPARRIEGSTLPPDGWQKPDFDDSTWVQHVSPIRTKYRELSLVCLRGKFEVTDQAKVSDLSLRVDFQGGAVVYINGREVARVFLPDGKITPETLATEYSLETYEGGDGKLLGNVDMSIDQINSWIAGKRFSQEYGELLLKRWRNMTVMIPASALRKGVNVLALEVHRAPANPAMFTNRRERVNGYSWFVERMNCWWNRVAVDDVKLCASASATGITPNCVRPKGVQAWNASVFNNVTPRQWGDPSPINPIRLVGLKNGAYSGQFVVSCDQPIKGLNVTVTDLKAPGGGTIPVTALSIRYANWWWTRYEALDPVAPKEVPIIDCSYNGANCPKSLLGAVQPVWLTVNVPKTTASGQYSGIATVTTASGKLAEMPVNIVVIGNYVLPDPKQFKFHMGVLESPDSLAMKYNVPMWSEAHWRLIDMAFEALALIGAKEVHIAGIAQTELGNEYSMVHWIKQADGTFKHDLSIAEKYLDTAIRRLGKVPLVVLTVLDTGGNMYTPTSKFMVTEQDPKTGALTNFEAPQWGTPEAQAFWKPVVDGVQQILDKRGLEKALCFGTACNGAVNKQQVADFKVLAPNAKWVNASHMNWNEGPCTVMGAGILQVNWDPETDKPVYGWTSKDPVLHLAASRGKQSAGMTTWSPLSMYRLCAEGCYLSSWGNDPLRVGMGHMGGDFWQVLKSPNGRDYKTLNERYNSWTSVTMNQRILYLLGPGRDGPMPTPSLRMMQEAVQESEVRIFVQNALLDETKKAKLESDLAKRANDLCNDRTRLFRYCSAFIGDNGVDYGQTINASEWQAESEKLFRMADEVQAALGKQTGH